MRVEQSIRASMMAVIGDNLQHATSPKTITFYEGEQIEDNIICVLTFDSLEVVSIGERASYKFVAPDSSYILRAAATETASAAVDGFVIRGQGGLGIITGTVGGLSSSADLKFSRTNWVDGTFITIQDLVLSLPQGT